MTKQEVIKYIDRLEWEAGQSDKFFIERNELYIENQKLKKKIDKAIKIMEDYTLFDLKAEKVMEVINLLKGNEE